MCCSSLPYKALVPCTFSDQGLAISIAEMVAGAEETRKWLAEKNSEYEKVHKDFEDQFWGTKMALASNAFSSDKLSETKTRMEDWLSDEKNLAKTKELLAKAEGLSESEKATLKIFERTFECYQMPEEAKSLRNEITQMESKLGEARNGMKLGYTDPTTKEFVQCSSVVLASKIRSAPDEAVRKAAFESLRSIGPFILDNGFVDVIKKRNTLARKLGFVDFYDMKVTQAEGFNKKRLFEILEDLEQKTRQKRDEAVALLRQKKGDNAWRPWNLPHAMAGDLVKKQDKYFPFEKAVLRYAQSFANMGIQYEGAELNLDLLDRAKKYSNGFCHWPQPAWVKADGSWQPSVANFTSLASPADVGSGKTALTTLMHEAGHAAHFANIKMPSPLFSQERAPTSVAYAENQSMFLDSLVGDSEWLVKYAVSRDNERMPFSLVEESIRETHPFAVFDLRRLILVPFFEKALYELPEADMTADRVQALADEIEQKIYGAAAQDGPAGTSPRPVLSVPHIMADEASCYYHGYVLAEMSVHQTRDYFLKKYNQLTDNPKIGPELTDAYWKCGNSEMFLDLVAGLTGKPLTADAWVAELEESIDAKVAASKLKYAEMEATLGAEASNKDADLASLNMVVRCVHGDEVIADSRDLGSIEAVSAKFEEYVAANYYGGESPEKKRKVGGA